MKWRGERGERGGREGDGGGRIGEERGGWRIGFVIEDRR